MAMRPARRPEKQLDLPAPAPPAWGERESSQLGVGDRIADEAGEWEIASRPHTTAGEKLCMHVFSAWDNPPRQRIGAYERVTVKRATAGEDKR
jgi:hypothetical protein